MSRITAEAVVVFDPKCVVDPSECDDVIEPGPLTLDRAQGPFAVVTTMRNPATGHAWYVVAYHLNRANAIDDYTFEAEQATLTANELDNDPASVDDYVHYTEHAAFIAL